MKELLGWIAVGLVVAATIIWTLALIAGGTWLIIWSCDNIVQFVSTHISTAPAMFG